MQLRIANELHLLESAGLGTAPERLKVFQEAARDIVHHFPLYGPLLGRLFAEYDKFVELVQSQLEERRQAERDLHMRISDYQSEAATWHQKLVESEAVHKEELERLDKRLKEGPSMLQLFRTVDALQIQIASLRDTNTHLNDKLGMTAQVRADFDRTIRSLENTFVIITDEKDVEIHKLQTKVSMEHQLCAEERQRHLRETRNLVHRLDTLEIEVDTLRKRESLLMERLRAADTRTVESARKLSVLREEMDNMAERLAQYEKGNPTAPRGYNSTPRPNKAEAVARIPTLGEASNYKTTASLMAAIYESYAALEQRCADARNTIAVMDECISQRLKQQQTQIERLAQLPSPRTSPQTAALLQPFRKMSGSTLTQPPEDDEGGDGTDGRRNSDSQQPPPAQ